MRQKAIPFTRLTLGFLLFFALTHGIAMAGKAMISSAHHDLSIHLFPESSELEGRDRIRINESQSGPLHLSLSPRAHVQSVRIDGRDHPLEGLSLSAGPYEVDQQTENGITATTYFSSENKHLSKRYLDTSLHYLKRYSDLFGDYPFDGFSVVENFFPTGYGFPGYTLMGGRILRLPFIPETSLPHEIVHNWWGNGVLVDSVSGNWCEGLTSYTADYLNKERISPEAAMDYRRQALRNYASLVSPTADFPLSRFKGRTDPVTKAVGYDKSAMVFHMLRREMGDATFWATLTADPDYHLFRRLSPEEMPPTVNTLKSASSLVLVVAKRLDRFGPPIARYLSRAMGLDPTRIIDETDFSQADAAGNDLLFVGLPEGPQWVELLPRELELTPNSFQLAGKHFDETVDVLFFVARHPDRSGNVVSLLHPLSPHAANPAALKIPHYGRFSYLAFSDGRNQAKGTWKVHASPMMVSWNPAKTP